MLYLFPAYRVFEIVFIVVDVVVLCGFGAAGILPMVPAVIAAVLSVPLIAVCARLAAVGKHQKIVGILYRDLKPEQFIAAYEPLLQKAKGHPVEENTVRNYLSTGYASKGDFDKAIELLQDAPEVNEKQKLRGKAIYLTNLCNIYLQMNELNKAEETWRELEALVDSDTEKKIGGDVAGTLYTLKNYIQCMRGWDADSNFLARMAQGASYPYHKVVSRYQWCLAQIAVKNYDGARANLERVAKEGVNLYVGKEAKVQLQKIEGKTGNLSGHGSSALPDGMKKERIVERKLLNRR